MRARKVFSPLRDKKVLITAGPTREYWDPVRFLSNGSSGQMGIALAREAAARGARVTLVLGPVPDPAPKPQKNLRVIRVVTARDMDAKVQSRLAGTHVFVGAAAVADYRPAVTLRQKIKGKLPRMDLKMVCNPDIIAKVAKSGPKRPPVVIGFALETDDVQKNATQKLKRKGLDWIVANKATNVGTPKGSVQLISRWNERIAIGRMSKERLAQQIWKRLLKRAVL